MALDFFRITRGLDIQTDDLTSNVQVLFGSGAPGGDAAEQDAAPVGSIFLRTDATADNLTTYQKHTAGAGADNWAASASKSYVDAVAAGLSWREPARIHEEATFADITAVETELNDTDSYAIIAVDTGTETFTISGDQTADFDVGEEIIVNGSTGNDGKYTVASATLVSTNTEIVVNEDITDATADGSIFDGVLGDIRVTTLVDGDRILISDLTTGNENVYIVTGTPGSGATLTEDSNLATDGDALLIQEGDHAEEQWVYDGTQWILFSSTQANPEFGHIRNFIGKDASGVEFPNYPSNDIVTDSSNLEYEIGHLDDALGTLSFTTPNVLTNYSDTFGTSTSPGTAATSDITSMFQSLDDQFGDGTITNVGGNWSLSDELNWNAGGTLTLTAAFDELNAAIGDRTYTEANLVTSGETIALSLNAIDVEFGDINNSAAYTADGFLAEATIAANDLQENLDAFNQEIGAQNEQGDSFTFTNVSALTTIDTIAEADFNNVLWHVQYKLSAGGGRQSYMVHALSNGTTVDFTTYAKLKTGSSIGDPGDDITTDGTNITFTINPGSTVDVTIKRISMSKLA